MWNKNEAGKYFTKDQNSFIKKIARVPLTSENS